MLMLQYSIDLKGTIGRYGWKTFWPRTTSNNSKSVLRSWSHSRQNQNRNKKSLWHLFKYFRRTWSNFSLFNRLKLKNHRSKKKKNDTSCLCRTLSNRIAFWSEKTNVTESMERNTRVSCSTIFSFSQSLLVYFCPLFLNNWITMGIDRSFISDVDSCCGNE